MTNVNFIVQLIDAKVIKNNYWIEFLAFADSMDKNRKYKIEFCGTEISTTLSLTDVREEKLKQELLKVFGYGPYKIAEIKEKIKNNNCFCL
jgi:hypothetical protein